MTLNRAERLDALVVDPELPIYDAISVMDRGGNGILLLCEGDRQFVGVVTDGDVRRALLRRESLDRPCRTIASRDPLVATAPVTSVEALHLMNRGRPFFVNQLPILDESGRLVDLILRRDLMADEPIDLTAVVMAGGSGTRLRPLTDDTPKPLLRVGDKPVMELLVRQLGDAGVRNVNITTHYRADQIKEHFGDGSRFGVDVRYVDEEEPLGTAGALSLLETADEPILVVNGDIVTRVNFRAMLDFHREHRAEMTVGVRRYDFQVPYGVLECSGPNVLRVVEKPQYDLLANAGIYMMEPSVIRYIPGGERYDMTQLIERLIDDGRHVVSFPIVEYWLDIGQHEDYRKARDDASNEREVDG